MKVAERPSPGKAEEIHPWTETETATVDALPLFPTQEGGEGRGEEDLSFWRAESEFGAPIHFLKHPSLRLSPRSFLAGRERKDRRVGYYFKNRSAVPGLTGGGLWGRDLV